MTYIARRIFVSFLVTSTFLVACAGAPLEESTATTPAPTQSLAQSLEEDCAGCQDASVGPYKVCNSPVEYYCCLAVYPHNPLGFRYAGCRQVSSCSSCGWSNESCVDTSQRTGVELDDLCDALPARKGLPDCSKGGTQNCVDAGPGTRTWTYRSGPGAFCRSCTLTFQCVPPICASDSHEE